MAGSKIIVDFVSAIGEKKVQLIALVRHGLHVGKLRPFVTGSYMSTHDVVRFDSSNARCRTSKSQPNPLAAMVAPPTPPGRGKGASSRQEFLRGSSAKTRTEVASPVSKITTSGPTHIKGFSERASRQLRILLRSRRRQKKRVSRETPPRRRRLEPTSGGSRCAQAGGRHELAPRLARRGDADAQVGIGHPSQDCELSVVRESADAQGHFWSHGIVELQKSSTQWKPQHACPETYSARRNATAR